ncbi:MAG: hypothetical protein ABW022_11620 [Actinoplanes sp.]
MTLTLENRNQPDGTAHIGPIALTPMVGENYWTYRVQLTEQQAILGFPKFNTIGIGFAVEEDWNTNLPYTVNAEEIYEHIEHNRGDSRIGREDCIEAIRLIQQAATADRGVAETAAERARSYGRAEAGR